MEDQQDGEEEEVSNGLEAGLEEACRYGQDRRSCAISAGDVVSSAGTCLLQP